MGILYLVSILILLILFILVKKSEKEINIMSFISISIVTLFCYNTFVCYILTFFKIQIKLWILTLINIFVSILFMILILKDRKIQKYIYCKMDFIYIIFILMIVLIIAYIYFGFPFAVNYEIGGDSSIHFLASAMFADSNYLLAAEENSDAVYGTLKTFKPGSYVNSGLLMKSICSDNSRFEYYNIFVLFGIFVFFLTGATMYSALINFARTKEHRLGAFIITTIGILGYPLNSFLFGFEYLSMGILIICAILDLVNYYEKELIDIKWFISIMALINLGLFLSYYMFVTYIYPALWIYFCIKNYNKNKKIVTKELILILLITLLIPFILGYIYALAPKIYSILINEQKDLNNVMENSKYLLNNGFKTDGYIYINLYSNMLLLLPLTIYLIIRTFKDKKRENTFIMLIIHFIIAVILLMFIGYKFDKISIYYMSKNYFVLWIILLYCNYKSLILLSEKNKFLSKLFIFFYIMLMIIFTIFSKVKVEYVTDNKEEKLYSLMDIFGANKTIMFEKQKEFNQEEIKILKYAKENLDFNKEIEVISDLNPYFWYYVLLDYINEEESLKGLTGQAKLHQEIQTLAYMKVGKIDYMIYFNKSEVYKSLKNYIFKNSEVIYENDWGGIVKYKE